MIEDLEKFNGFLKTDFGNAPSVIDKILDRVDAALYPMMKKIAYVMKDFW